MKRGIFVAYCLLALSLLLNLSLTIAHALDIIGEAETVATVPNGITVIVDAGHGGEDCGAIGASGIYEKDLNLTIAEILSENLREAGFTVVMTRTSDRLLYREEENIKGMRKIYDLKNRVAIANSYEKAIFISVHMNSFTDSRYSGFTTYYSSAHGSEALAMAVQSSVVERLQNNNNRKIKAGEGLYLLENSKNPAVLLECGFLSNPDECKRLCDKDYQKQLSFSIICGIIDYIEHTADGFN